MYHCKLNILVIEETGAIAEQLRKMPVPERFEQVLCENTKLCYEQIKNTDVIIWDTELSGEELDAGMKEICKQKKSDAKILLFLSYEVMNLCDDKTFSIVEDICPKPYTKESIQFFFKKFWDRQKAEKECWLYQNYLDALIDGIPDLVWFKDKIGAHLKVNEAFCETVNKTKEQIQGRGHFYIWDIEPEEYNKGEYICMESEEEVMQAQTTCVFEEKVKIKDEMRLLCTYKSPIFDIDGSVMGTVGLAHDVTEARRNQEQIIKNANTDFLTELYNRRYFYTYMEEHNGEPMTLLFIDLDYFKKINDKLGHDMGDMVLVTVADLLREVFPGQMIARMGGDEFVVGVLGECAIEEIKEKCDLFLHRLKATYKDEPDLNLVSASIGISQSSGKDKNADMLIKESDKAMYEEKRKRKQKS